MINLPVEILSHDRVHLRSLRMPEARWFYEADEDEVDLCRATNIREAFDPNDATHTPTHLIFRYKCSDGRNRTLCVPIDNEPELTAEDYAEWCAASCGCGYYTYIGKPWLD